MAAFTSDVQLTIRAGSGVDQAAANRELRDLLRDAIRGGIGLLGDGAPTEQQIGTFSTAECRPWCQKLARSFLRDLARSQRVRAAEETHMRPVREAPDTTEDAP